MNIYKIFNVQASECLKINMTISCIYVSFPNSSQSLLGSSIQMQNTECYTLIFKLYYSNNTLPFVSIAIVLGCWLHCVHLEFWNSRVCAEFLNKRQTWLELVQWKVLRKAKRNRFFERIASYDTYLFSRHDKNRQAIAPCSMVRWNLPTEKKKNK